MVVIGLTLFLFFFSKFFKHITNCVRTLPNAVIYGELNVMSFEHHMNLRLLQYWWRISNLPCEHPISSILKGIPRSRLSFQSRAESALRLYDIKEDPGKMMKKEWTNWVRSKIKTHCDEKWNMLRKQSTALERLYNKHKLNSDLPLYLKLSDGYAARVNLLLVVY